MSALAMVRNRLQARDQVTVAAIGRRMIGVLRFVEPSRAFVLMAARPASVHGTIRDCNVIRDDLQLPVDPQFAHHTAHQGRSRVNRDQVIEKTHVAHSFPCGCSQFVVFDIDLDHLASARLSLFPMLVRQTLSLPTPEHRRACLIRTANAW
jgi:hypothetical protein